MAEEAEIVEGGRFDSWKRVGYYLVINLIKTKIKANVKQKVNNNNKNNLFKGGVEYVLWA